MAEDVNEDAINEAGAQAFRDLAVSGLPARSGLLGSLAVLIVNERLRGDRPTARLRQDLPELKRIYARVLTCPLQGPFPEADVKSMLRATLGAARAAAADHGRRN